MKKWFKKIFACAVMSAVMLSFISVQVLAADYIVVPMEFGDYAGDNDFDFGGYDSGGYDYGGSYDSGDYDYGGGDYDYGGGDYDYGDDDYDSGSYGGGNVFYFGGGSGDYYGGSGGSISTVIGLAILIAIVVIVIRNKNGKNTTIHGSYVKPDPSLLPMADYKNIDPDFSESEFKEKISGLYVRFQSSWQAKDLTDVRQYLSDSLYAQVDRQLENYRTNGRTNRVDGVTVQNVRLVGYKQEQGADIIVAELRTRIKDYVVDDATGNIVRGDPNKEKFMCYHWTLARTTGYSQQKQEGFHARTCPHCGAPVDINQSTVCEYCDSVLVDDTFDWVVNNIEAISQQTV